MFTNKRFYYPRLLLLTTLFALQLLPTSVYAGRYRQPAYVTNAYFSNSLTADTRNLESTHIINVIRAGYPNSQGYMILDLLVDKGKHHFSVELLDSAGRVFSRNDFPAAAASKDNFVINLNLRYGGDMPDGGIFFKLYDQYENKEKVVIGTFRITSEQWHGVSTFE